MAVNIYGPETWSERHGVAFTYWDRWLLRLAADEDHGLDDLARRFVGDRQDVRGGLWRQDDAEAKLAQIVDLKRRLTKCGLSANAVLGSADRADKKLLRKAQEKLFRQGLEQRYRTPAMLDTPRRRLEERALRGHWGSFPVSPALYERSLQSWIGGGFHDWRTTPSLAQLLGNQVDRVGGALQSAAEKLGFYRAVATAIDQSMAHIDDSSGMMGETFRDAWKVYVGLPWRETGIDPLTYVRDLIDFAVWEDYGLIEDLDRPLRGLRASEAVIADRVIGETVTELRDGGFDYQEEKALRYQVEFLVARKLHERFVEMAVRLGTRAWRPITSMAEAALAAGNRELAKAVFAAADQPGSHQQYLRGESARVFGKPVVAVTLRRVK